MSPGAEAGVTLLVFGAFSLSITIGTIYRRQRTGGLGHVPPGDIDSTPPRTFAEGSDDCLVLRGGAWVNGVNVTWPLATLRIDPDQAELEVFGTTPVRISRAEVVGLRWVQGLTARGLKFRTASGRLDKMTFWVFSRRTTAERLSRLGWH